jgi:hypothetical protein
VSDRIREGSFIIQTYLIDLSQLHIIKRLCKEEAEMLGQAR